MIDHLGVTVSDLAKSKAFYTAALAPLEIKILRDLPVVAAFGRGQKPELWVVGTKASYQSEAQYKAITPNHVCLRARNRDEVDAFYKAAMAAGGRDFGPPGIRAEYHPNYYGAFVLDPDGHNIEACFHGPA
ncbi:MAG: VOC family protein [Sandaracinaceae bacterium]|nr:VOC family protein [Sandaracinaceae bacterium]